MERIDKGASDKRDGKGERCISREREREKKRKKKRKEEKER